MKRKVITILLSLFILSGLFAQDTGTDTDFELLKETFQDFADALAPVLPFNSTIGLNWSDAYIGQLFALPPHLGVGVTVGATTIPYNAMKPVLDTFKVGELPPDLQFMEKYGLPIPAYTVEARVGGLLLPFDIGVKIGLLPETLTEDLPFNAEYILAGADIRIAILKETFFLPDISVGAGLNYLMGSVALSGLLGSDMEVTDIEVPDKNDPNITHTYSLSLTDPKLAFSWETTVFDFKFEISKSLLIITPYIGAGATFGGATAGGGLTSKLIMKDENGNEVEDIQAILNTLGELGIIDASTVDTNPGITVEKTVDASWSLRAFGGVSLNLLILKIDVTGLYNFTGKNYGVSVNARLQL